jgi:hypothetical protein
MVRTQAGFKQTIKDAVDVNDWQPDNYPTKYPSLVSITAGYCGSLYPQVRWIHINDLQEHIKGI